MTRGTTPTILFNLINVPTEIIEKLVITFSQNGQKVFEKNKDDVVIEGTTVCCSISEEETLSLLPKCVVCYQMRCTTITGEVIATPIYKEIVYDVLNESFLTTTISKE